MLDATTLATRRSDLEGRIAALKAETGAAIVDGKLFDAGAVATLEDELDALTAAEGELAKRARAEAAAEEAARRKALRTRYSELEAERLETLAEAEKAGRAFADAAREALALAAKQRAILSELRAEIPLALMPNEYADRLGHRLSLAIRNITHPSHFGGIVIDVGPHPDGPWTDGLAAPLQKETHE